MDFLTNLIVPSPSTPFREFQNAPYRSFAPVITGFPSTPFREFLSRPQYFALEVFQLRLLLLPLGSFDVTTPLHESCSLRCPFYSL